MGQFLHFACQLSRQAGVHQPLEGIDLAQRRIQPYGPNFYNFIDKGLLSMAESSVPFEIQYDKIQEASLPCSKNGRPSL